MGYWRPNIIILFSLIFTACFFYSDGSVIDCSFATLGEHAWIRDTFRGTFWQNQTTNIEGIHDISLGGITGNRPYVSINAIDSRFELATTDLFDEYEEVEVSEHMIISARFRCPGGTISQVPLTVQINIQDTNNNPPTFIFPPSSNEFVFTIATPVPPGYEVTGCLHDLIVRDIDLTTEKIIFRIDDNPHFEIESEVKVNTATPKMFKAILRTKTFIRSIPEPIKLTIYATDHDRTDDDSITRSTTVTIIGSDDFELPEEPVFSETLYRADYTDENRVVLTNPISLRSGYDELVKFDIKGDLSENFELITNPDQENQRSIRVITALEGDVLKKSNIHLIVTAEREHTSGASATVVLRMPEVVPLKFERAHYEGTIENNHLDVPRLILSQGYLGATVTANVMHEHFFGVVQENKVTLSMTSLPESVIAENNFLNLEVIATNGRSTATTIVTLEIIKDDNVTPVFNKPIYTGSYDSAGLTLDHIVLVQGHDRIEEVTLRGDNEDYFKPKLTGNTVTIEVPETIPPEIYAKERIVLTLEVKKPRTVGASATIIISLPPARELKFGASRHRGTFQNNQITLDPIPLTVGYDNSVVFSLTGDHAGNFRVTNNQNPAIITLETSIPDGAILENNIIYLTLTASGLNAVTTTTSVLLDIIKDDTTTPVFDRNIYYGTYLHTSQVNIDDIYLTQGFGSDVSLRLDGDHAGYFDFRREGNKVEVFRVHPIPENVIFKEKVFVFNILAEKALTVGASAAISIKFPSALTDPVVMRFEQNTYYGTIENNDLTADNIVLSSGYAAGTQFIPTGDYSNFISITPNNNVLSLSLPNGLPIAAAENAFIVLEIEATREGAVPDRTSVVIDIVRSKTVSPVFTETYYRGAYNAESGLQFTPLISLSSGYDETVTFSLDGEFEPPLFRLDPRGTNSFSIVAVASISNEILQANSQFLITVVAKKPGAITARAVISIHIEKDATDRVIMRFEQNTYYGTIENNDLTADNIVLSSGYAAGTQFIPTGDYSNFISITPNNNVLSLSLPNGLPIAAAENAFIVLEIEATREGAVPDRTSVVIDIVRSKIVSPVFAETYYRGAYNAESGLQFTPLISLSSGYDETVTFSLDGEFEPPLFRLDPRGTNSYSIVAVASISNEILQANSQFLITVVAKKPGAITARAVISIHIEKDATDRVIMRFEQNTYYGTIENNDLTADNIVLSSGYAAGTQFIPTGDYSNFISITPNNNVLSLSLPNGLPIAAAENAFIVLEIEATREGAVPDRTSVVIDIVRSKIVSPVFTETYYRGAYNAESGLQFTPLISLSSGYDETVTFSLDGEFEPPLFRLDPRGTNSFSIVAVASISNEILQANSQFLITVVAKKPGAITARAVISIHIEKDATDRVIMRFEQNTYYGTIENNDLTADNIVLSSGYAAGTQFIPTGDYSNFISITPNNNVLSLSLPNGLPIAAAENAFIVLEIEATREGAVPDRTSVVIDIVRSKIVSPVFTETYYRGAYNAESGLQFTPLISLSSGYDETVTFSLDGEFEPPLFRLDPRGTNSFSIVAVASISNEILQANSQFLITVVAKKPGAITARAVISIHIEKDATDRVIMRFEQNTYYGTIENNDLTADNIVLSSGYAAGTQFIPTGDYSNFISITPNNNVLSLSLPNGLPIAAAENAFIVLEIEATREGAVPDRTSVVIDIVRSKIVSPVFAETYYRGAYNAESGLQFTPLISLSSGYDETVTFSLDGEFEPPLFRLDPRGTNSYSIVDVASISNEILQANSQFLITVVAKKPGAITARAVISIHIEKDATDRVIMRFEQNTYYGTIENNDLTADNIVLSSGYAAGTQFIPTGDYSNFISITPNNNVLSLSLPNGLPIAAAENAFIVLEIEATREGAVPDRTSVVIDIVRSKIVSPVFAETYYRGAYNAESGLQFTPLISLSSGYDETVTFSLDGEFEPPLFRLDPRGTNSYSIVAVASISNEILQANSQFLITVVAKKPGAITARAVISIHIEKGSQTGATFESVLHQGVIQLNEVRHGLITITGYDGTSVQLFGVYSSQFEGHVSEGEVTVQARESLNLPSDVTHLSLELHAADARAVLLLNVLEPGVPIIPTVTFSSESYVLSVSMEQTGIVGRVSATADNTEAVTYSLGTDNGHLQTRLSINNEGELHLSASANSGVYTFQVIATTVNTRATGTASVHLTVQAATVCENKGREMDPLIILDRDEEEPHKNLIVFDPTVHAGCHFTLTNIWPTNQLWLYVDKDGLHTHLIDREDKSIAFMAVSQVQVELILHCQDDSPSRVKRSEITERLGPYDYGDNKWILADTIRYNSRRSLVNLIVNDINDNSPVFVGKENEPIAVGYPTDELEERILPRSLAELKATDADIGENAALRYSSTESVLAVAPTTGFVHVRTGAQLQNNQILTITATDRNGQGREGTIQLVVKLLNLSHIAVVTIRNAFLDDETTILAQLSDAVGYEVKTLRSVVISDDIDDDVTRNKRETSTTSASLQLYVYGIIEKDPVTVNRLAVDISTNAALASVVRTIPLEDHLQDMNILDRQIGLLVTTIILSVLLFVVILLVAIWFFLRWRKNRNYNEFSDENSLASRNASLGELPKPEVPKPRLNIEDLKKSEKRLQEMLHAPIEEVTVEPMTKRTEPAPPAESILDLPIPEPGVPIVIQSIDKLKDAEETSDDEFGEVSAKPRKSVVTFNENVEKIIHVEDNDEDDDDENDDDNHDGHIDIVANINPNINVNVDASNLGYEIYRL